MGSSLTIGRMEVEGKETRGKRIPSREGKIRWMRSRKPIATPPASSCCAGRGRGPARVPTSAPFCCVVVPPSKSWPGTSYAAFLSDSYLCTTATRLALAPGDISPRFSSSLGAALGGSARPERFPDFINLLVPVPLCAKSTHGQSCDARLYRQRDEGALNVAGPVRGYAPYSAVCSQTSIS